MVTQESACRIGFEDNDHDKQPLDLDHSDLVKFSWQSDNTYARVLNKLRNVVKDAPNTVNNRFSSRSGT